MLINKLYILRDITVLFLLEAPSTNIIMEIFSLIGAIIIKLIIIVK